MFITVIWCFKIWQVSANVDLIHMVASVGNASLVFGTSLIVNAVNVMAMLTHVTPTPVYVMSVGTTLQDRTVPCKSACIHRFYCYCACL